MLQQERDQLTHFLSALESATIGNKEADAEKLIKESLARQPDAGYLLVQRCLLMDQALQNAQNQIAALQQQVKSNEAGRQSSFLGSNPWGRAPAGEVSSVPVPGAGNYQMPGNARNTAGPAAPWQGQPAQGGGGSSFLGNIATTAAGVVAGSFLFQGIEGLMHHQGGGYFSGNEGHEAAAEQTTINNYYGSDDTGNENGYNSSDNGFLASDDQDYSSDDDSSDWV
ncbi:DUF2076 domain-containing protein [Candidatus Methylospira mobilis]|uniref:DUF2076 domain-containing protein n=1 Tax=Candidatus Methylospira mobilis TaxID=1808979 RepID=UPI0028ECB098|nr:DUF2076 domain-containing protein [Candidatus Methylospira mobilis]WNV03545.1 DUF2076 domain-containing protein [Candidatus Methylospira mobilis]